MVIQMSRVIILGDDIFDKVSDYLLANQDKLNLTNYDALNLLTLKEDDNYLQDLYNKLVTAKALGLSFKEYIIKLKLNGDSNE